MQKRQEQSLLEVTNITQQKEDYLKKCYTVEASTLNPCTMPDSSIEGWKHFMLKMNTARWGWLSKQVSFCTVDKMRGLKISASTSSKIKLFGLSTAKTCSLSRHTTNFTDMMGP